MNSPSPAASARWRTLCKWLLLFAVTACAAWTRFVAVDRLPPDYDELIYLPIAYDYRAMLERGTPADVLHYNRNYEHPPGVKLVYALAAPDVVTQPPNNRPAWHATPDWSRLNVGRPMPPEARAAFRDTREISALGGALQAALLATASPLAGLALAFDTYQVKYAAQVYLDGIPGVFMILAVLCFERARRDRWALVTHAADDAAAAATSSAWLAAAAVALGLAAAGKYLYALPGVVMVAFLALGTRRATTTTAFLVLSLAVSVAANPYLWPNAVERLWESVSYHWAYAHGKHVTESALPWWYQLTYLVTAAPMEWHQSVFATSVADRLMLPLAVLGFWAAWRRRPVWAAWAAFGVVFLLLWPTKWPQYTLLVRPALYMCAAVGVMAAVSHLRTRLRGTHVA